MAGIRKKTAFFCQECGYESAKWAGQCPSCKAWNSMVEEPIRISSSKSSAAAARGLSGSRTPFSLGGDNRSLQPVPLSQVKDLAETRFSTGFSELDRVLGGGAVAGSLVLFGGDPGIGKSTILLQTSCHMAAAGISVLYISGEESLRQIKLRAMRIGSAPDTLKFLCETGLGTISDIILRSKPQVVVIDSIQTMYSDDIQSAPGSVSQVRETTAVLLRLAKETGITFFIVGHVTKDGSVAGPRVLEHMVDTVLYIEGERYFSYRVLRGVKNRFGSTNELGMFEMENEGMVEIKNPSSILISEREGNPAGSIIVVSIEGTRPMLLELQALTVPSVFGIPRRNAIGIDYNRLTLLMAVIEKRAGFNLGSQDAYLNIVGGIRVNEPALDLGIVLATVSSFKNRSIKNDVVAIGEVGLTGEVRSVNMIEKRIKEAEKMGYKTIIIPQSNKKVLKDKFDLDIIGVADINQALKYLDLK